MIVDLYALNINQNQNQHLTLKVLNYHTQIFLGTPKNNLFGTCQTTQ